MLDTLGEKIHDNRLLGFGQMLAAGYLEDWVWNATLSGVPQGGVLSPVPFKHRPGPAGPVRRHDPDAGIQPRGAQETQP